MLKREMNIADYDAELWQAMEQEKVRQEEHIELIASENYTSPRVMQAQGSQLTNKYAEGYPGKRYYGGCEYVDIVEQLAIDRAKELFGADYANVQPHSGSQANFAVYTALLEPGDTVLGMNLAHGGHLTHGSPVNFSGKLSQVGLDPNRRKASGVKAAIIREKGTNSEREMAYSFWLAGFDVKDVTMTDLVSGRENLEDVNVIAFCGGFSNSDVLGSAKGWAGAFLYNPKAKAALDNFYSRMDTLSLGVCNGCQLMVELGLLNHKNAVTDSTDYAQMMHNDSHKFESEFVTLAIPQNNSIMFGSLSNCKIGTWVAHGEGKFRLPLDEKQYNIVARYNYSGYPANPNGSDYDVAALCSKDGRHLAIMPRPERTIFTWQCGTYPVSRWGDEMTPWLSAFVNARVWVEQQQRMNDTALGLI